MRTINENDQIITIEVRRGDIETLLDDTTSCWHHSALVKRVRAAIPEPEWEPSEEQVQKVHGIIYASSPSQFGRAYCHSLLKEMHKAGLL